jgi:phenylalanine-4-hydroxylase
MKQEFEKYTQEDRDVWKILFERQIKNLQGKSSDHYLNALDSMKEVLNADSMPNFKDITTWFESSTGWEIYCVPGLIPVDEFFILLSEKKFPSSTWLRSMEKLDYLEEPDMFHDVFGHIPLLCNPIFSNFIHEFGKLGKSLIHDEEKLLMLQRLYWFTIEFGLIQEQEVKIYGAGIMSSFGEAISSLKPETEKKKFVLEEVLNMEFITTEMQSFYFVIDSLEELFESIVHLSKKWNANELVN